MPKKKSKHPKNMTSDELLKHLFHPKVAEHVKKVAGKSKKSMKGK
jgi:hypothetical protein